MTACCDSNIFFWASTMVLASPAATASGWMIASCPIMPEGVAMPNADMLIAPMYILTASAQF